MTSFGKPLRISYQSEIRNFRNRFWSHRNKAVIKLIKKKKKKKNPVIGLICLMKAKGDMLDQSRKVSVTFRQLTSYTLIAASVLDLHIQVNTHQLW